MSPTSLIHPAQHLTNDRLDVLVVDLHALQTVDFLHFVDQVLGERFSPSTSRMSCGLSGPSMSGSPAWTRSPSFTSTRDAARTKIRSAPTSGMMLSLRWPLVSLHRTKRCHRFADDGRVLRLAGFEEFGHARQTAGDVLGLRRFAGDLRDRVAGLTSSPSRP